MDNVPWLKNAAYFQALPINLHAWPNAKGVTNASTFHLCEQAGIDTEKKCQDLHLNGTVWDLIPEVIGTMYEHQREAFEFIWTI